MTLACREWAGPLGVATKHAAYDRLVELKNALTPELARYPSARFQARGYFSTGDMENDLLDPERMTTVAGAPPLLWLNITYDHPEIPADAFDEVLRRFDLRLLGEFVDRR
ncbi:hypothetical protein ACWDOP_01950 [Nocardia sp. NPDC003693]